VRSLAEILADPGALDPPEVVAPRLAWRGRVVLLAAREKEGKSTIASAATAAVSSGRRFLGDTAARGAVLYAALEDHEGEVAQRLVGFRADPQNVFIVTALADPGALAEAVAITSPVLIVVDTLAAFTAAIGPKSGAAEDWVPVMAQLTRLARESDAAVLLLHHARKSDGRYRDSTAIGAGVDVVLEMAEGGESSVRRIEARGRWAMSPFSVRLAGSPDDLADAWRYELVSGELSVEARVVLFVERNAGCSLRQVREGVQGRMKEIGAAIARLMQAGELENRGTGAAYELHLAGESGSRPGTGQEGTGSDGNPYGTRAEPGSGTGEQATGSRSPSLGTARREPVPGKAASEEETPW
jgi:hypothetical protein